MPQGHLPCWKKWVGIVNKSPKATWFIFMTSKGFEFETQREFCKEFGHVRAKVSPKAIVGPWCKFYMEKVLLLPSLVGFVPASWQLLTGNSRRGKPLWAVLQYSYTLLMAQLGKPVLRTLLQTLRFPSTSLSSESPAVAHSCPLSGGFVCCKCRSTREKNESSSKQQ